MTEWPVAKQPLRIPPTLRVYSYVPDVLRLLMKLTQHRAIVTEAFLLHG